MNKIFFRALLAITTVGMTGNIFAQSVYVGPAGAAGSCGDCHIGGTRSQSFVPWLFPLFESKGLIDANLATVRDKITAIHSLTDAQRLPVWNEVKVILNPVSPYPDTAPVVKTGNTILNVTVGEEPLVIPFTVKDAESDSFEIKGQGGLVVSAVTVDNATSTSNFTLTWADIDAVYAGLTYPIGISVKENQRSLGRTMASNLQKASITVWPARANAATAQVGQFDLTSAKWQRSSNTLRLTGTVVCKIAGTACLKGLNLNLASAKGTVIGSPIALTPDALGASWTASLPATALQVPCNVVANYEGLKAKRPVVSAPRASCVK